MNETKPLPLPAPRVEHFERLDGKRVQSVVDEVVEEFKGKARSRSLLHKFVSWLFWTATRASETDVLLDTVLDAGTKYVDAAEDNYRLRAQVEKLTKDLKTADEAYDENVHQHTRNIHELRESQALICNKLAESNEALETAKIQANVWEQTAAKVSVDRDYYRGLVVKIGKLFGKDAYTSDDGSVQQDVLCAKVPDLVRAAHQALVHKEGAIADLKERCEQRLRERNQIQEERDLYWKKLQALRKRRKAKTKTAPTEKAA